MIIICKCKRCDHEWATNEEKWQENNGQPYQCPKCKSAKWRIPKENENKGKN